MTSSYKRVTENQVNYVVWRYLQESGFGEAAVKLQRDWNVNPQSLPFAEFVKTHALVNLIHKGLQYCELETTLIQNGRCRGPPEYIFGPPSRITVPSEKEEEDDEDRGKRRSHELPDREGDAMDIDAPRPPQPPPPTIQQQQQQQPNGVAPTPLPHPARPAPPAPAPSPPVVLRPKTTGPSVSTQMEPPIELAGSVLHTETSHVLHCTWNPVDPNCLATAGTNALTRIWKIVDPTEDAVTQSSSSSSSPSTLIKAEHVELMGEDRTWYPTEICWDPSGALLAVASYNWETMDDGRLNLWTKKGYIRVVLRPSFKPVLIMRWNPVGDLLLGICTDGGTTEIKSWDPVTGDAVYTRDHPHPLEHATWFDNDEFFVAGNWSLDIFRIDDPEPMSRDFELRQDKVVWWRNDLVTGRIASTTYDSTVVICGKDNQLLHTYRGHTGTICSIEWQPLKEGSSFNQGQPRRLATCSVDGTIRIWNGVEPYQCLRVYPFGKARLPVLDMAFSPDGSLIAGASETKVLIWDVNSPSRFPRASWELKETTPRAAVVNDDHVHDHDHDDGDIDNNDTKLVDGTTTATTTTTMNGNHHHHQRQPITLQQNEEVEEQEEPKRESSDESDVPPYSLLSWNQDGSKLALAYKTRIAIIGVPPLSPLLLQPS
ncbi:MAG: hypothetical protein M1816_002347 [Peltula sp. TS41687]|nr:MAG: hypothetical protein M1816_002347 [Peltula sp. TS41687]